MAAYKTPDQDSATDAADEGTTGAADGLAEHTFQVTHYVCPAGSGTPVRVHGSERSSYEDAVAWMRDRLGTA